METRTKQNEGTRTGRRKNGEGHQSVSLTAGKYRYPRTVAGAGVRQSTQTDGHGNLCTFWTATIMAGGVTRIAKFSCGHYGTAEATTANLIRFAILKREESRREYDPKIVRWLRAEMRCRSLCARGYAGHIDLLEHPAVIAATEEYRRLSAVMLGVGQPEPAKK